jgi:hypothetical protein
MFQLTPEEAAEPSRSQFVILKRGQNIKYLPYVFTENGVAMLSGVLGSERRGQAVVQMLTPINPLLYLDDNKKSVVRLIQQY